MKRTLIIVFSIIIGSGIIAGGIYFGLKEGLKNLKINPQEVKTPAPSTKPTPTKQASLATPTPKPSLIPSPTPTPQISWTNDDVLQALSVKDGTAKDKIDFSIAKTIRKDNKVLIMGSMKEKETVSGALFLGVIDKNGVKITFIGNGVPLCQEVNPYGYPTSWIDYCVTSTGKTVKR